jgi:hypothetical protein
MGYFITMVCPAIQCCTILSDIVIGEESNSGVHGRLNEYFDMYNEENIIQLEAKYIVG